MTKKITWLIVIRILLVTLFLSVGALLFKVERSVFYFLIAAVYFLSIVYLAWLLSRRAPKWLIIAQLTVDCVLVAAIVMYTGSIDSIFTTLFVVLIFITSMVVSPAVGLLTTGFASSLYIGQLLLTVHGLVPFSMHEPWVKDVSLILYTVYVHVITFILVGVLAAILARKIGQMEYKIRESEQLSIMGQLAAEIAHEIRNPLAAISGSIELLQEELHGTLDAKNAEVMTAVVKESERVSEILEQFLDFAKLDNFEVHYVRVGTVLDEIMTLLEHMKIPSSIRVVRTYGVPGPALRCDVNKIKQVCWNLIRNAVDAMPDGGTLSVGATEKLGDVILTVADTGIGISSQKKKEVFVPFHSTKPDGLGVGLFIAHTIVGKHGGTITFESADSKGTVFTVTLPQSGGQ